MSKTCGFCKGAVFVDNEGEVQDVPHGGPHDCAEVLLAERDALKLQNDELRKTLGSAIQYVEHSRIGHPRNEETLEIVFDPTCFKCKALRVYFGPEEQQTEKRKGLLCCGEDHLLLQGVPCPKQFRECAGCREAGTYCEAHRIG